MIYLCHSVFDDNIQFLLWSVLSWQPRPAHDIVAGGLTDGTYAIYSQPVAWDASNAWYSIVPWCCLVYSTYPFRDWCVLVRKLFKDGIINIHSIIHILRLKNIMYVGIHNIRFKTFNINGIPITHCGDLVYMFWLLFRYPKYHCIMIRIHWGVGNNIIGVKFIPTCHHQI